MPMLRGGPHGNFRRILWEGFFHKHEANKGLNLLVTVIRNDYEDLNHENMS